MLSNPVFLVQNMGQKKHWMHFQFQVVHLKIPIVCLIQVLTKTISPASLLANLFLFTESHNDEPILYTICDIIPQ